MLTNHLSEPSPESCIKGRAGERPSFGCANPKSGRFWLCAVVTKSNDGRDPLRLAVSGLDIYSIGVTSEALKLRLYMAPEILRYEKYDAKADLWSVGAVLYEMAVGKPPFRAQNHVELLKKIEHSKGIKFPDEDTQRAADDPNPAIPVPSDIKKLIMALLKRHPVERSSFDEFFGSTALARSKFPRPAERRDPSPTATTAEEDAVDEE